MKSLKECFSTAHISSGVKEPTDINALADGIFEISLSRSGAQRIRPLIQKWKLILMRVLERLILSSGISVTILNLITTNAFLRSG
ncbi:MAG: hypothetical protein R3A12_16905 [Ignavibacteria bacterium]